MDRNAAARFIVGLSMVVVPDSLVWAQREAEKSPGTLLTVVGKVVEVKGNYGKVRVSSKPLTDLTKGDTGQLVDEEGRVVSSQVAVTALHERFVVVRARNGEPQVGLSFVVSREDAAKVHVTELHELQSAVGKFVSVTLRAGRVFDRVELLRVDADEPDNVRIRVRSKNAKRPLTISLSAIDRITADGARIYRSSENPNDAPKKFSRKQALLAKQHAAYEAKMKKWEQLICKTGARKWEPLQTKDHDEAIAEHKDFIETFKDDYPNLKQYETAHFLFVSNIAPAHLAPYLKQLDAMHELMMQMYGIPEDVRVWKGKALIVAFVAREQFMHFEQKHLKQPPPVGAYGICHSGADGQVIVACFRGRDPADFGQMLVHETSHGFMHRYKTATRVPSWLNEGLADHLGATIVPASLDVPRRQQRALERLAMTRSLGGILGANKRNIRSDQYGLSSLLVGFLIRSGEQQFADLIDNLKAGLDFRESLLASYKKTPDELVRAFGLSIGMPNLKP